VAKGTDAPHATTKPAGASHPTTPPPATGKATTPTKPSKPNSGTVDLGY
jgi:hypothetical protein